MASSPPASSGDVNGLHHRLRRSHISSSPAGPSDFDVRWENRNSEETHKAALDEARQRHNDVHEAARRVLELHAAEERARTLQRQNEENEKRIALQEQEAAAEIKARELENRQRSVPKPPPRVPTPPAPSLPQSARLPPQSAPQSAPPARTAPSAQVSPTAQLTTQVTPAQAAPPQSNPFQRQQAARPSGPPVQPPQSNPQPQPQPQLQQQPQQTLQPHQPPQPQQTATPIPKPQSSLGSLSPIHPDADRLLEIHKNLKRLRTYVNDTASKNPALKKQLGEMRRGIRQSIGQLTGEKGANKDPIERIMRTLIESFDQKTVPIEGLDPSHLMISSPQPQEGAAHNEQLLPAAFLFLLNHFAKAIIAQLINESGVRPETADPIGVVAVTIFSKTAFMWRGTTLVDILIAKFRVACPVLFGIRGNDTTEQGRARLGWRKEGMDGEEKTWVSTSDHTMRMTGLGAGYAAIAMRDFSRTTAIEHPYPPTGYWQSMARILATPRNQVCPTQYVVLRAMIENYEAKFIAFYGIAAFAALQVALVHFPARAPVQDSATKSLGVLADKMMRDWNVDLKADAFRV